VSILNLQTMTPIAAETAVAVISFTSSGSDCCKKQPARSAA
jgi:hypothetical protein